MPGFCVDCLQEALQSNGAPETFNMEGQSIYQHGWSGRALDNIFVKRLWRTVKFEDIYLKGYVIPDKIYRTGQGGEACCIADKYRKADQKNSNGDMVNTKLRRLKRIRPT